jgi:glucose/arabinose dehydrogenase
VIFTGSKNIDRNEKILSSYGRLRDVVYHDGYLYIATSNRDGRGFPVEDDDKILRIKPV